MSQDSGKFIGFADPAKASSSAAESAAASFAGIGPGPAPTPRWVGQRIGRFRLISKLGKGSYGRVYLAEDEDLQRRVAVKVLTTRRVAKRLGGGVAAGTGQSALSDINAMAQRTLDKVIHEARMAARIDHPNVVQIFEVGRLPDGSTDSVPHEGGPGGFVVMELLEGGSLQDIINASGPMDVARACALVADAAEALQAAHDLGVIHRDVKPANLMLSRFGRCKVVDFGLACVDDTGSGGQRKRLAGTALYIAPELVRGTEPNAPSDQYSLASTLFTLLAGKPAFECDAGELLRYHRVTSESTPPPSLRAVRPDIEPRLDAIIARAMSGDPNARFENVRQFGQALRLFTVALQTDHTLDAAASSLNGDGAGWVPPTPVERPVVPAARESEPLPPPRRIPMAASVAATSRVPSRPRQGTQLPPWFWAAAGVFALLVCITIAFWAGGALSGESDDERTTQLAAAAAEPEMRSAVPKARQTSTNPPGESRKDSTAPEAPPAEADRKRSPPAPDRGLPDLRAPQKGVDPRLLPPRGTLPPPDAQENPPKRDPEADPKAEGEGAAGEGAAGEADSKGEEADGDGEAADGQEEPSQKDPFIAPGQYDRLVNIAMGRDKNYPDGEVTIMGVVREAIVRRGDRAIMIHFEGAEDKKSFFAFCPARSAAMPAVRKLLGDDAGTALKGKKVAIQGKLRLRGGVPQIDIVAPHQIEVVGPGVGQDPRKKGGEASKQKGAEPRRPGGTRQSGPPQGGPIR